jgi:hypothetical protein
VLARSLYKFDRSRDPDSYRDIPGYKSGGGHWRSVVPKALTDAEGERHGVQAISMAVICHGAGF